MIVDFPQFSKQYQVNNIMPVTQTLADQYIRNVYRMDICEKHVQLLK